MIKKSLINKQRTSIRLRKLITSFFMVVFLYSCATSTSQQDESPKSWQDFDQKFKGLGEKISFLASEIIDHECTTVHAIDPDQSSAVGSSFKLYILAELANQIAAQNVPVESPGSDGKTYLSWNTLLPIQSSYKSIPAGGLLFVPENTQYTVRYYAEQMIQRSDNTATDHLLYLLGRKKIEQQMLVTGHHNPAQNIPLFSTREFAVMKFLYSDKEIADYFAKSIVDKRALLNDEQRGYQQLEYYFAQNGDQQKPVRIDELEWFASRYDMCRVLVSLHNTAKQKNMQSVTEILSLDDPLNIDREQWSYVGFKGGSEFGVLAGNWLLQRNDARLFVLSFALSNKQSDIDKQAVVSILQSALALLSQTP